MTPEFARAFYGMMSAVQRAAALEAACPPVRPCVVPAPDQLATRIEITVVTDVSEAVARVLRERGGELNPARARPSEPSNICQSPK